MHSRRGPHPSTAANYSATISPRSYAANPPQLAASQSFSFDGDQRLVNACDLFTKVAIISAFTITTVQVMWYWRDALREQNASLASLATRHEPSPGLLFYNRPPDTHSPLVHAALSQAARAAGFSEAPCFATPHWNELVLHTSLRRHAPSFYGCAVRLPATRQRAVERARANVTFVTDTRPGRHVLVAEFLRRRRPGAGADVRREAAAFARFVRGYGVGGLLGFHGVGERLRACPYREAHVGAMRAAAARYEAVVDLRRPGESADMVEIVSGLRPRFAAPAEVAWNGAPRALVEALLEVDTSAVDCGNELVHTVLMQQFNIIKDRLMQNGCFDEVTGSSRLCDAVQLNKSEVVGRDRGAAFRLKQQRVDKVSQLAGES